MYQSGDQVVYGVHGVCVVTGTEHRIVDRKQVDYLVLEPLDQPGTKFLVPSGNASRYGKIASHDRPGKPADATPIRRCERKYVDRR